MQDYRYWNKNRRIAKVYVSCVLHRKEFPMKYIAHKDGEREQSVIEHLKGTAR